MKIGCILVVIISLMTFSAANAQPYRGHGSMAFGSGYGFPERVSAELNLTVEQSDQIRALREAHLNEIRPLRDKLYSKSSELRTLWLEREPNQGKIEAVSLDIKELREQMRNKITAYRVSVLNVLSPEQRDKLQAYGPAGGLGEGRGRGMGMRAH